MVVILLHHTPLDVMMKAIRTSHDSVANMDTVTNLLGEKDRKLLEKIVTHRHDSVLEHVVYSFDIHGISRALLQELSRHRHISMTVKSTRFTLKKALRSFQSASGYERMLEIVTEYCVIPPFKNPIALEEFIGKMYMIFETIYKLNLPNDHAKYFLPECFKTSLVLTVNARELAHIINLRSAKKALWEFQNLARELYFVVFRAHPVLWELLAQRHGWEVSEWEELRKERAIEVNTSL